MTVAVVYLPVWVVPLAAWLIIAAYAVGTDLRKTWRRRRRQPFVWADDSGDEALS